jgi:hypothetical protein
LVDKRTERSIDAVFGKVITGAVSGFETVWVVHLFNYVVGKRAVFAAHFEVALLARVGGETSMVVFRVVVNTLL